MERRRAEREGSAPRTLQEIDYLLLVDDEARLGALRFAECAGGPFLREEGAKRIPPMVELPKLLSAAEHVMEDKDTEEDLRLLFAPGSSLGGARPKASVIENDGRLAIAKFPRKDDETNTVLWEGVALALAKKSGITVPENRVEIVADKPVLLLRRFDRDGNRRIPFLSAMSGWITPSASAGRCSMSSTCSENTERATSLASAPFAMPSPICFSPARARS
jgi:serine/threonine-protein kinase HipA